MITLQGIGVVVVEDGAGQVDCTVLTTSKGAFQGNFRPFSRDFDEFSVTSFVSGSSSANMGTDEAHGPQVIHGACAEDEL